MNILQFIEIIAVIFSLFSAVYGIRKSRKTWTTGVLSYIAYAIIFFCSKLYCNSILQFVFIAQSIWGYSLWRKEKDVSKADPEYQSSLMFTVFVILSLLMCVYFKLFTDNADPYLDSISTACSIVALYLMSYKLIENWIWWIIADVLYIIMFVNQHLYLSASLYIVFLILCVIAYNKWKNDARQR